MNCIPSLGDQIVERFLRSDGIEMQPLSARADVDFKIVQEEFTRLVCGWIMKTPKFLCQLRINEFADRASIHSLESNLHGFLHAIFDIRFPCSQCHNQSRALQYFGSLGILFVQNVEVRQ